MKNIKTNIDIIKKLPKTLTGYERLHESHLLEPTYIDNGERTIPAGTITSEPISLYHKVVVLVFDDLEVRYSLEEFCLMLTAGLLELVK